MTNLAQPGVAQELAGLAGTQQNGVDIKRAPPDRKPGQRVERIVLDDTDEPARADHTSRLAQERGPIPGRNVVHDTGGEDHVELIVGARKQHPLVGLVLHGRVGQARLRKALFRHVHAAQPDEMIAHEGMKRSDAAADVEERRLHAGPEMRGDDIAEQIGLGLREEIVLQPGEVDRGLDDLPVALAVGVEQFRHLACAQALTRAGASLPIDCGRSKPTRLSTT